ncbi:MAG TPA: tetratricopeptide repeat protein [Dongiaceae bacterium]|nr:tetratricopeptide repeat protein [Dongiaceae bacterium]
MDGDRLASYSDLTAEGNILVRRGDFRRAIENFERAVRLAEDLQDAALNVKALLNLSTARLAAGQIKEAEKGLREILLKTRDPQTIFVTSSNLASALRRQGRLDRALLYARRAMRACENLDNVSWRATCHNLLGNIYMNMSYLDDAVAEYRFALELGEKGGLGTAYPVDYIKENLGYCLLLKKRYRQGVAIILEAQQIALRNDNTRCLAECHQDLCFAYMQLKDLPRAREHGEKSLEVALKQDYRDIQKNCYYLLGETHLLMGDDVVSDRYFDRLQEFYPEVPVIKDFLRTFDVSSIINLKNPV